MRISTKGRFAVNAMIDLCLREGAGPVALAAIAARQQISLSYLEQLFARLRVAGLVASTRGPGGGYTLGRDAASISIADIVSTVEPMEEAADGAAESADGPQLSAGLWQQLHEVMLRHLATISLRAIGTPAWMVWITVLVQPSTESKAHTAADIASCTGYSRTVASVMMPSVPSEPTNRRVRS